MTHSPDLTDWNARYKGRLESWGRRRGLDPLAAEDLAQEVALALLRWGRSDHPAYVFTVARNLLYERSTRTSGKVAARDPADLPAPPVPFELGAKTDLRELFEQVRTFIDGLPDKERDVMRMEARDRGGQDAAAELGMTRNAAYLAKRRAIEKTRAALPAVRRALADGATTGHYAGGRLRAIVLGADGETEAYALGDPLRLGRDGYLTGRVTVRSDDVGLARRVTGGVLLLSAPGDDAARVVPSMPFGVEWPAGESRAQLELRAFVHVPGDGEQPVQWPSDGVELVLLALGDAH